jgi:N utilization substance protein B
MGARRKGRELALQALYLTDISGIPADKALNSLIRQSSVDKKTIQFAEKLTQSVKNHLSSLDEIIKKYTANWDIKRMAALDRNILRLGSYEIVEEEETPISVIIDEAVEIAKTYSTSDSGKFVNGILDKIQVERKNKQKSTNP